MEKKNAWLSYTEEDTIKLEEIAKGYIDFISNNKIERECTEEIIKRAEQHGFKDLDEYVKNKTHLFPGDKIYVNNRNKSVALFVIGSDSIDEGMNILGAHID